MKLGEKIRYLRFAEGILRGLGREMTQAEVVNAARREEGKTLSQAYLSQIESGARPHLTSTTRQILARFFKVHPGFLVDDPEGFHTELVSNLPARENKIDQWLMEGADRFARDAEVSSALEKLARHENTRQCLILMGAILDAPDLVPRLLHALRPGHVDAPEAGRSHAASKGAQSGSSESRGSRLADAGQPEQPAVVRSPQFKRGRRRK